MFQGLVLPLNAVVGGVDGHMQRLRFENVHPPLIQKRQRQSCEYSTLFKPNLYAEYLFDQHQETRFPNEHSLWYVANT